MKTNADDGRARHLDGVLALVRTRVASAQRGALERFVGRYFGQVDSEDLEERAPADLYGAALSHWNFARKREPAWPLSSSTSAIKQISVLVGRSFAEASSISAERNTATLPLVSHAPRPWIRPALCRGVNCFSSATPTVSMCGASTMRCRTLPDGSSRAMRLERSGRTF